MSSLDDPEIQDSGNPEIDQNLIKKVTSNFSLLKSNSSNIHRQGSFLLATFSGPQDQGQVSSRQLSNNKVLQLPSKHEGIPLQVQGNSCSQDTFVQDSSG